MLGVYLLLACALHSAGNFGDREGGVVQIREELPKQSAEDRKWQEKCQKIRDFDKVDKISPADCKTLSWALQHCSDCKEVAIDPSPPPTPAVTVAMDPDIRDCLDSMINFCPESKLNSGWITPGGKFDMLVEWANRTFAQWCSEKTPRSKELSGLIPKAGEQVPRSSRSIASVAKIFQIHTTLDFFRSPHFDPKSTTGDERDLNVDWLRTRKLAAAAMLRQMKLDPYRQPDGFTQNLRPFEKNCSLCDSSVHPSEDWPATFGVWRHGTYSLIDDFYIGSVEGGLRREMGRPQFVQNLDVDELFKKSVLHTANAQLDSEGHFQPDGKIPKYMSVVHDGEQFMMYIPDFPLPNAPQSDSCAISLATSVDGVHWRAEPGLPGSTCSSRASTRHQWQANAYITSKQRPHAVTLSHFGIYTDAEFCVTHHPLDSPEWRFKMVRLIRHISYSPKNIPVHPIAISNISAEIIIVIVIVIVVPL
jgi:hypothetical protein